MDWLEFEKLSSGELRQYQLVVLVECWIEQSKALLGYEQLLEKEEGISRSFQMVITFQRELLAMSEVLAIVKEEIE